MLARRPRCPQPRLGRAVRLGVNDLDRRRDDAQRGRDRERPAPAPRHVVPAAPKHWSSPCLRSRAPPCSASSTRSPTRRSKAPPCSASCAATRTSSWSTGSTRSCNTQDSDLHRIVKHYELDAGGAGRATSPPRSTACRAAPPRSPTSPSWIEDAVERGWVYGSLMFGDTQVRTGYLIVGMLKTTRPAQRAAVDLEAVRPHQGRGPDRQLRQAARRARPREAQRASDGSGDAGDAGRGERRDRAGGDGQAGGAEAVHRRPDRAGAQAARSIRSPAATRRSARSSTS